MEIFKKILHWITFPFVFSVFIVVFIASITGLILESLGIIEEEEEGY